ncbi:MAG: hypothetical protein O7C58_07625 [Rickettsia endosymbiont of Ixodes persulcatus]|nr:hypothetical protein [Rickettsia endosymbiont of Ixodes persulcatus]
MQYKDTYQLANSIIDYYINQASKYPLMIIKRFQVQVDYGNGGAVFIDVLRKKIIKRNIQ